MCSNIYVKTKLNFNIFLLFLSFFCCSQWIWTQLIKWYSLLNYIFFIYTATYFSLGKKAWSVIWTKLNLLQWTKICFMFSWNCPSGFWEYFVVNLQRFIQYCLMLNKFYFFSLNTKMHCIRNMKMWKFKRQTNNELLKISENLRWAKLESRKFEKGVPSISIYPACPLKALWYIY